MNVDLARENLKQYALAVDIDLYEMSHALDETRRAYARLPYGKAPLPSKTESLRKAAKWLDDVTQKYMVHLKAHDAYWEICCQNGLGKELKNFKPNWEGELHEFQDRTQKEEKSQRTEDVE